MGDEEGCDAPRAPCLIVMGVAGAGKSTLASALGAEFGLPYLDADAYHPPENVEKMKRGEPLTDQDRAGWLATLRGLLERRRISGGPRRSPSLVAKDATRGEAIDRGAEGELSALRRFVTATFVALEAGYSRTKSGRK